jgi:HlyD family secretion protein
MREMFDKTLAFLSAVRSFVFKTLRRLALLLLAALIFAGCAFCGLLLHGWMFNSKDYNPATVVTFARRAAGDLIMPGSEPETGLGRLRLQAALWLKPKEQSGKKSQSPYSAFARGRVDVDGGIVKLSASKDGVIENLYVDEGDLVKKGQPLAKQDDRKERLDWELKKAKADYAAKKIQPITVQLEAARREQKRQYNLIKNEVISNKEWDMANDTVNNLSANLAVAQSEARVALAEQKQSEYEMELKTIRAPDDGKILRCDARPGYGVSTLNVTVLFLFIPSKPFIVRAEIEEKFLNDIKPGQTVDIVPDTDETKIIPGKVAKIGNYLGPKRQFMDEPQERSDVRTTECIISVDDKSLILGQRVLVKFRRLDPRKK